nr:hypothetical protein [Bradyrhizobium macuxiense]
MFEIERAINDRAAIMLTIITTPVASTTSVGSRAGAPHGHAFVAMHVSGPLHLARSMQISRTARPHLRQFKGYGTYHVGATFVVSYFTP